VVEFRSGALALICAVPPLVLLNIAVPGGDTGMTARENKVV
jgi:hypothetical protein